MANIKSEDITHELFLYAVEQYKISNNYNQVDMNNVKEEYQRFWLIIKLFSTYRNSGEVNIRLLLNHFIILTNIFQISAVHILLAIALDKEDFDIISYTLTLLNFIGYVAEDRHFYIKEQEYLYTDIPFDRPLMRKLQGILNEQD